MKKLIALSAAAVMASSAAMADVAITGAASVSYDDNGSAASATTYDADLTFTGTAGDTTLTASWDLDSNTMSAIDFATTIGPVSIAADMFDEVSIEASTVSGGQIFETTDTSVTVSLDVPVGGLTLALDDSGDITLSADVAGVTITQVIGDTNSTAAAASIAGMDINLKNKANATTWDITTTVSGVTLTLDSENDVTAEFGLAGNTLTVAHNAERAAADNTQTAYATTKVLAYTTVAITRDLTSGATLTATYSSKDDSLTLKAAVSF